MDQASKKPSKNIANCLYAPPPIFMKGDTHKS